ncbi:hypothetical protein ACFU99_26240 [Streptomyces sp. NPDC057654]|uniref:hypothetical protein n=1 Tax=Streptomyces sp. NPDC057654 TaxID=3346196 RepID=UPI0036812C6D
MHPSSTQRRGSAGGESTGLAGRDFLLLLAATVGTFSNYAPLLSVAPLWSAQGGSGNAGVGAVTGVTMATTVGVQLCMRWLLRRLSLRQVLMAGALGGVTTFLPLALSDSSAAPVALFLLSGAIVVGRWAAGVFSDRRGTGKLLVPSVLGCVLGMGGLGLATAGSGDASVLAAVAASVYGLGFGALQNDTLVIMFRRAGPRGHGAASTAWNMAYDAGTGIGAVAVGLTSHALGVDGSFSAAAVLILLAAPLALRDTRTEHRIAQLSPDEIQAEAPTHTPQ